MRWAVRTRRSGDRTAVRSPNTPGGLRRIVLVALGAAVVSSGCSGLIPAPPTAAVFDLGDAAGLANVSIALADRVEVRAPSWLDTAAMQYRLAYQRPSSSGAYAASKWTAPPAEMLQRMIARTPVIGDDPAGSCRLVIELDEFVQVFEQPQTSAASLLARVELAALDAAPNGPAQHCRGDVRQET